MIRWIRYRALVISCWWNRRQCSRGHHRFDRRGSWSRCRRQHDPSGWSVSQQTEPAPCDHDSPCGFVHRRPTGRTAVRGLCYQHERLAG